MHVDVGLSSQVDEAPYSLLCINPYELADNRSIVECKTTNICLDVLLVKGKLDVVLKVKSVV